MSSNTPASTSSWAHFSHDADIGVVGVGPTKAEVFRQVALALTAVVTDPSKVQPLQPVPVFCQAPNDELLLVEWLNTLIGVDRRHDGHCFIHPGRHGGR